MTQANPYRCNMCGASFPSREKLEEHNKTHMSSKQASPTGTAGQEKGKEPNVKK